MLKILWRASPHLNTITQYLSIHPFPLRPLVSHPSINEIHITVITIKISTNELRNVRGINIFHQLYITLTTTYIRSSIYYAASGLTTATIQLYSVWDSKIVSAVVSKIDEQLFMFTFAEGHSIVHLIVLFPVFLFRTAGHLVFHGNLLRGAVSKVGDNGHIWRQMEAIG